MRNAPNTFTIINGNVIKESFDPTLDAKARETYEAMELELLIREEKKYGKTQQLD